jgi:hypothetical protein
MRNRQFQHPRRQLPGGLFECNRLVYINGYGDIVPLSGVVGAARFGLETYKHKSGVTA